jgi:CYTH domain-containing protein/predicted ATPase
VSESQPQPQAQEEIENERRWIVRSIDPDIFSAPRSLIEQGYVEKDLRVRVVTSCGDGRRKGVLTLKAGKGVSRPEKNLQIDESAAQMLLDSTKYRLKKMRYVRQGWEVDVYEDKLKGLVVAEYENKDIEKVRAVTLPPWIHDAVEVTDTVTNRQLAKMAYFLDDTTESGPPVRELINLSVPRIVLTGAPCSGKSSALRRLKAEDPTLHCVPETATIVLGQIEITPAIGTKIFQHTIRRVQVSFEDAAVQQAIKNGKRAVILDRGTLDSAAFMGGLGEYERQLRTLRDLEFQRYDAVIALQLPAREVFEAERANNPVRQESYDDAVRAEKALNDVWDEHAGFIYIADRPTWEAKYEAVKDAIGHVLNWGKLARNLQ